MDRSIDFQQTVQHAFYYNNLKTNISLQINDELTMNKKNSLL